MLKLINTFSVIIILASLISAQEIPNPGFENWTGNNPDSWLANNPPTGPPAVTPNSNAHSGSFCARLEVVEFSGFPFPPTLSAGVDGVGFPVSQRYENLTGYYKFSPSSGDYFDISIFMWEGGLGGTVIGTGTFSSQTGVADWTQFSVPINYVAQGTPDLCSMLILVGIYQNSGGVALVDDLAFGGASDVEPIKDGLIPKQFELNQNYPNPFNPSTSIEYSIPSESFVELKVYDVLGNEVASLVNEQQQAGVYRADFTGENLPSGIYFARITANEFTQIVKMILLK